MTFMFGSTVNSIAELNGKNWELVCSDKSNKNCSIGVIYSVKNKNSGKVQKFATTYLKLGTTSEKKLNLINKEEQTYKLGELKSRVHLLYADVPLNADLRQRPLIRVDGKDFANMEYLHCNQQVGCKSVVAFKNNSVIDMFKKANQMSIVVKTFGNGRNIEIIFPLKGFTKSYKKLSKINS